MLFVGLILLPSTLPEAGWIGVIAQLAALFFGIGLAAFVVLIVWRRFWVRQVSRLLGILPSHLGDRLAALVDRFITGLGVLRQPGQVALALGLSVLVWTVGATVYYFVGASLGVTSRRLAPS